MTQSLASIVLLLLASGTATGEVLVVDSIPAGSPAAAAGVRVGDRIAELDGRKISTLDDLQQSVSTHRPGDVVSLVVERAGEPVKLTLTFGERRDGGA